MKKICFLLCLLLMLSALVACGDKDDTGRDTPESTASTTQKAGLVLSVSDEITIGVGETKLITAINSKTGMQTTTVHWDSDNKEVADVDFEGKVTGKADGTAVITATSVDGKESASCTVTVTSVLSGITLDPTQLTLNQGETAELTVGFIPESFSDADVQWVSGDESVATVDENGIVTALKGGKTTIAVSSGDFTAVCSVNVINPVTSITLSEELIPLVKGKSIQLNATVLPSDASDTSITWSSSNPAAVGVSDTGMVTAYLGGTATITAMTSNGLTASCSIVVSVPVTGVTLTPQELILDPGDIQQLTCSIAPVDANVQDVIWSSDNPDVAVVDTKGTVTAIKAGSAVITVTSVEGYYTATCSVTVENSITGLTFEETEGDLLIGQSLTLVPIKTPETADDSEYTWESADPEIASVDENGKVTAIKEGRVIISATTENGVKAEFSLNVIDPASINVTIQQIMVDDMEVIEGNVFRLDITLIPSNATEKYKITSNKPSCVAVNDDGTLTAIKKGTVIITVTSESGAASQQCIVTVSAMTQAEKDRLQAEYDRKRAQLDREHNDALADINDEYDGDIAKYTAAVNNQSIDENSYNSQKRAIQAAMLTADAATKQQLQAELDSLEADWAAYQLSVQRLNSAKEAKQSAVDAENARYEQQVKELDAEYAFLFN